MIGVLAMAACIVAVIVAERTGWRFLQTPIEAQLSRALHRDVRFGGGFSLHLWRRIGLQAGELVVHQPIWAAKPEMWQLGPLDKPMARVRRLDLELPYGCVRQIVFNHAPQACRINRIEADELEVMLLRDATGRANWALGDPAATRRDEPPPSKTFAASSLPKVDRLAVKHGRMLIHDAVLMLDLDAQVDTREGAEAVGAPGLHLTGTGTFRGNSFNVQLRSTGAIALLAPEHDAPAVPFFIQARAGTSKLDFEGSSRDVLSLNSLDGQVRLAGPSLAAVGDLVGVTLPTTAHFALDGRVSKDGNVWKLDMRSLHVGSSELTGSFSLDRTARVPRLTGKVSGPQLAFVDLAPAFGAPVEGAPNPQLPAGRTLPRKEFDVPSLKAMNANLTVRLQHVTLGRLFAQPIEPLDATVHLQDGILTVTDLLARVAGGSLNGDFRLDSTGGQLDWNAAIRWSGIALDRWLHAPDKYARASGKSDASSSYVSGLLVGQARLHGQGNSPAAMLASLNGSGKVWIVKGQISHLLVEAIGLHVADALGLVIVGDKPIPMLCAASRLTVKNGLVHTDVALVDTPYATVLAGGSVSLAQEQLALTITSQPKQLKLLSLHTPIDVRGTFANPRVGLRAQPLGVKILAAAALGAVTPLAALIPLIDVGRDQPGGCAQALQRLRDTPRDEPPGRVQGLPEKD